MSIGNYISLELDVYKFSCIIHGERFQRFYTEVILYSNSCRAKIVLLPPFEKKINKEFRECNII